MSLRKVPYTAEASPEAGREGVVPSADRRLEVSLSVPAELPGAGGDGTNLSNSSRWVRSCYQSALFLVAAGRKIDTSGSRVTVRVGLRPTGTGGMGLARSLASTPPGIGTRGRRRRPGTQPASTNGAIVEIIFCSGVTTSNCSCSLSNSSWMVQPDRSPGIPRGSLLGSMS